MVLSYLLLRMLLKGGTKMSALPRESHEDAGASAVQSLDVSQREDLSGRVGTLIAAREQGIRYAEGRLNSLALLSGGLIAAGIAFLSLGLAESISSIRWGLTGVALGLFILALALLLIYARSTNPRYPFIDNEADVKKARWKWFYWDALPDPSAFASIGLWGRHRKGKREAEIGETNGQFAVFAERMVEGLTDDAVDVAEDLRQLYTLHINERYKNQYLTNVRTVLQRGLVGVIAAGVVAALLGGVLPDGDNGDGASVQSTDGVHREFDWSDASTDEATTEVQVAITIENLSGSTFEYKQLTAIDAHGFPLPSSGETVEGSLLDGERATMLVTVVVPTSYRKAVDSWELE